MTADERAQIYDWLAGIFAREPSAEVLAAYRSEAGADFLDALTAHAPLTPLVAALRRHADAPQHLEASARDLAGAFSRLFLGVGGRRSAPPYESAYTSERGLLFQQAAADSRESLARLDLRVGSGFAEPPDHIAVQLAVMAELARRADDPEGQRAFLEARLLSWVGRFRDDCAAADPTGFYAAAAAAVAGFVAADAARFTS